MQQIPAVGKVGVEDKKRKRESTTACSSRCVSGWGIDAKKGGKTYKFVKRQTNEQWILILGLCERCSTSREKSVVNAKGEVRSEKETSQVTVVSHSTKETKPVPVS